MFTTRRSSSPLLISALTIATVLISGCQSHTSAKTTPLPAPKPPTVTTSSAVQEKAIGEGLYEMALFSPSSTLYVASAQSFKNDNGGVLYKVNPTTLAITGITHTDLKNFGIASQPDNDFFYTTNSLDGTVSKVEVKSGKVVKRLALSKKNSKGETDGARELLWVGHELYVGCCCGIPWSRA